MSKKQKCEVYSRVVGYLSPVSKWNKGKQEEFKDRKNYDINQKLNSNQSMG
jgi:anaerobic ribonucleoside-triphosphate reductase